jgi:hypothetical protein
MDVNDDKQASEEDKKASEDDKKASAAAGEEGQQASEAAGDDFEDIQLDVDTNLAKYTTDHDSSHFKENGKDKTVITDQPIDAVPPNVYVSDVTVNNTDVPVIRQGPLKPKPKDFVVTSCFIILCCNFIFGLLGYHFGGKYQPRIISKT